MKKLLTFCLLVVSVITLSACGDSNKKEEVHYADKDFLNSFVVGLQKRWDYVESDQGKKDSDDKYSDYIVKANEYELNSLKNYKDEKFKDSKLQEKAIAYINAINKNIDTAKKYTGFDLLEKSEASHSERTVILTEIIKEYKPKFDEKYQKYADDLMKKDKEYYVEMELGYETDTYDAEGKKTRIYDGIIEYDEQNVRDVINSFVGIQDQIPPMYSALKVNGKKMYEMAREGIEIERKPRRVEIYSIRDITIKGKMITFYVEVSSGTYIRSLVRDIGEKLSFWATMTKLIRTKIDKFSLENTFLFEEIEKLDNKEELIIDIESLFDYEHIILSKNELLKLSNGMTTILELSKHTISNAEDLTNKKLKVYSSNNEFVGIANILKFDESNMYIKRDKYFVLNPNIST